MTTGSIRSAVARRYPGLAAAQHAVNVNLVIDYIGASICLPGDSGRNRCPIARER